MGTGKKKKQGKTPRRSAESNSPPRTRSQTWKQLSPDPAVPKVNGEEVVVLNEGDSRDLDQIQHKAKGAEKNPILSHSVEGHHAEGDGDQMGENADPRVGMRGIQDSTKPALQPIQSDPSLEATSNLEEAKTDFALPVRVEPMDNKAKEMVQSDAIQPIGLSPTVNSLPPPSPAATNLTVARSAMPQLYIYIYKK